MNSQNNLLGRKSSTGFKCLFGLFINVLLQLISPNAGASQYGTSANERIELIDLFIQRASEQGLVRTLQETNDFDNSFHTRNSFLYCLSSDEKVLAHSIAPGLQRKNFLTNLQPSARLAVIGALGSAVDNGHLESTYFTSSGLKVSLSFRRYDDVVIVVQSKLPTP